MCVAIEIPKAARTHVFTDPISCIARGTERIWLCTHRVLLGFLCGRARCATVYVAVYLCSKCWATDVDFQSWLDEGDHFGVLFVAVPVGLGVKDRLSRRNSGTTGRDLFSDGVTWVMTLV